MLDNETPKSWSPCGKLGEVRECLPAIDQIPGDGFADTLCYPAIIALAVSPVPFEKGFPRMQSINF
jgi:hypothetical protein